MIQAAVEREVKKLPLLKPTTRTRIFNIKFRNFRLTDHSDDANKNIKGNFQVKTSNGKTLPLWNQGNYSGIFNNDLYSNPNTDWIVVKQESDINGKLPPLSLTFEGSLTEQDDIVGEGDDDRMDIIEGKALNISGLTGVKNHVVKFHHTYLSGTQRMTVEADISVRPGFGFADEFTPAGGLNRNGGANKGGLYPRVNATPAPNVKFDRRPTTSSPSKPKPNPNPATPTASTGNFSYGNGNSEHQYLVGDWNGDGKDKPAIRRNNKLLYNFNLDGRHDKEQNFGNGNSERQYLAGDWNGDGKDNIAIRRNGKILYDFNFDGRHDLEQNFGNGNGESQYLVGDWNGDGRDNIAVRRNGKILYDFNFDDRHDLEQNYGNGNGENQYLVGDWDGDGRDNIAVRRGNNILLDYNFDGRADRTISFGNGNSESEYLVGDWNGDGKDDIGVRRGSKIYINQL
ncbi:MAG: FG-GAP repeat domain-containing protein [Chitinophagales bacterium]